MAENVNERRIVVGVDASESSKQALRWAVRQAELVGANVDAVHALHTPTADGWTPMVNISDDLAKAGRQMVLDTIAEVAGDRPPVTIYARVIEGHPAFVLLQAAEGASLVLGCRGHGGFVGALLGSVSQHCVQHATCPVVVIRGPHN